MQRHALTTSKKQAKPPAKGADTAFEDEFHRLLGKLVHETARFDFQVGLQLNWLGPAAKVEVAKFLKPTGETLSTRLAALQDVVREAFKQAGPQAIGEFDSWFTRAAAARALRNAYAHGRWGVPAKFVESPGGTGQARVPLLAFVPLDWDLTPGQPDRSIYMTLEDFRGEVEDAVGVFHEFLRLANRYLAHVR